MMISACELRLTLEGRDVTISNQVRRLEVAKRRALWALADLRPGDELTGQGMFNVIEIQSNSGQRLVIEDSMPEPWRQRFSAASVGSTRLAAGPYLRDFQKFVMSWNDEMEHLKAHRESRQEGGRSEKDDNENGRGR